MIRWGFNLILGEPWSLLTCAEEAKLWWLRLLLGALASSAFYSTGMLPLRFALVSFPLELAARLWTLYTSPFCHIRGFLSEALATSATLALGLALSAWREVSSRRKALLAAASETGDLAAAPSNQDKKTQ